MYENPDNQNMATLKHKILSQGILSLLSNMGSYFNLRVATKQLMYGDPQN